MYSPESMIDGLMRTVRLIKEVDPTSIIMVAAAGRASTYVATLATLMGRHVRVGMEDTIWKWPHRDDVITNNAEQFKLAAGIAKSLGREIMSADESQADARSWRPPSKNAHEIILCPRHLRDRHSCSHGRDRSNVRSPGS
jgi:uncharacterized protein (DUF849 family)